MILLGVLLATLPWTYGLAQRAVQYLTGASWRKAALVVETDQTQGAVREIWRGVGQGFEKPTDGDLRLKDVSGLLKNVGVRYVRIDHVFDGYGVVGREGGRLTYNWSRLDALVGDIVAAGATPYISLSYMPSEISRGDILDTPKEWGEWGQVVAALVGHYSRDYRGGLSNVIYEVWNEPDLFGGWKMYGDKNYVTMYSVASRAAVGVRGAKPFKIGGPATTGFYTAWVDGFYKKLDESVRIDFFSWHRYSADVGDFVADVTEAARRIAPQITKAQDLYISEWGVNPERSKLYDSTFAAAHYLAVNRALVGSAVDLALPFEVLDGGFAEAQWHGGWGMLTNPRYGAVAKKPRFRALELLSQMGGERLAVSGEGDYVTSFATRDSGGVVRVMAVNYDEAGKHTEVVPLSVSGLVDGTYEVVEQYLSGRRVVNRIVPDGGIISREIALGASDAVVVTVTGNK